jgi:hypothetical protein
LKTVADLAAGNVDAYMNGPKKTVFRGIGPDTLRKFHAQAALLSTPGARPYLKADPALPVARREILFDVEADQLRNGGFVYLHGCASGVVFFLNRPTPPGILEGNRKRRKHNVYQPLPVSLRHRMG